MHAVIVGTPAERRLQRLTSADLAEHRISHGCINVPTSFFNDVAVPTFAQRGGIVYILPDTRALGEVFLWHRRPSQIGSRSSLPALPIIEGRSAARVRSGADPSRPQWRSERGAGSPLVSALEVADDESLDIEDALGRARSVVIVGGEV